MEKKLKRDKNGKEGNQKRRKRWYKIVSTLAGLVVVCTVYMLMLPALTLEQPNDAGVVESDTAYGSVPDAATSSDDSQAAPDASSGAAHNQAAEHQTADSHTDQAAADSQTGEAAKTDAAAGSVDTGSGTATGADSSADGASSSVDTTSDATSAAADTATGADSSADGTGTVKNNSESYDELSPDQTADTGSAGIDTEAADEDVSDDKADLETEADWEATVHDVISAEDWNDLTWAQKLLAVAETQLGYKESVLNFKVDTEGNHKGYTRYGAWYGDAYGDWCAMFVSFCLNYAGIDQEAIPQNANCASWVKELKELEIYEDADLYIPEAGDIVFFDQSDADKPNHVGIISEVRMGTKTVTRHVAADGSAVEDSTLNALKVINALTSGDSSADLLKTEEVEIPVAEGIKVIEGNSSNQVQYVDYDLTNEKILGYVSLTNARDVYEGVEADTDGTMTTLQYKGTDYLIKVEYGADAAIPEGTRLRVSELEEGSKDYDDYYGRAVDKLIEDSSANDEEELDITFARFFDLKFMTTDGEEIEPAAPVSVKINYTDPVEIKSDQTAKVVHFAKEASTETENSKETAVPADTAQTAVDKTPQADSTEAAAAEQTEVPEIIQPDVTSNTTFEFEQGSFSVTATIITSADYYELAGGQQYIIYTSGNQALSHAGDKVGVMTLTETPVADKEYEDAAFSSDILWTYEVSSTAGQGSFYYIDSSGNKKYLALSRTGQSGRGGNYSYNVTITDSKSSFSGSSNVETNLTVSDGYIEFSGSSHGRGSSYYIRIADSVVSATENSYGQNRTSFNFAAIKEKYVAPEQVKPTLTHQKYIKQITEGEEYDLTLTVSADKSAGDEKAKVDVVFVLDVSGSMGYGLNTESNAGWGQKSRITAANEALTSLANNLSKDLDMRYALVTFSGSKSNVGYYYSYDSVSYNDAMIKDTWSDRKGFIGSLPTEVNGGTNYQAGLMKAEELLKDARSDAQKVVVFISDGDPTFYYDDSGMTAGNGNSDDDGTAMSNAKTQLGKMTSLNYFFAVGVGPSSSYSHLKTLLEGIPTGVNQGLQEVDYYFEGSNESNINNAVAQIKQKIQYVDVEGVVVTDKLSEYAELTDLNASPVITVTDKDGKAVEGASCENGVLKINGTEIATARILDDGKTIKMTFNDTNIAALTADQKKKVRYEYNYAMTVKIKPTELAVNTYAANGFNYGATVGDEGTDAKDNFTSSGKPGFYSNSKATVSYKFTNDTATQTELYAHPVIQVVYQAYELPETGGSGVSLIYLLGGVLFMTPFVVRIASKRGRERREG